MEKSNPKGPAEELRAAATLLRRRGAEATPGPWERPLNTRYKHIVTAAKPDDEQGRYLDGRPERVGVVQLNIWSDGKHTRKRGGRDLEWIALMSPAVADHLFAWLHDAANDMAGAEVVGSKLPDAADPIEYCDEPDSVRHALAFARTILRAASHGSEAGR